MPHFEKSQYGPPRKEELSFATRPSDGTDIFCPTVLDTSLEVNAVDELMGGLLQVGPILRQLLYIPFIEKRNGVHFTRIPESWINTIEQNSLVSAIPAVKKILEVLRESKKTKVVTHKTPHDPTEVRMVEFTDKSFLSDYLIPRAQLEDLLISCQLIACRPHIVRGTAEFGPGDRVSSREFHFGDTIIVEDAWRNKITFRVKIPKKSEVNPQCILSPTHIEGPHEETLKQRLIETYKLIILGSHDLEDRSVTLAEPINDPNSEFSYHSVTLAKKYGNIYALCPLGTEAADTDQNTGLLVSRISIVSSKEIETPLRDTLKIRERLLRKRAAEEFNFRPLKNENDQSIEIASKSVSDLLIQIHSKGNEIKSFGFFENAGTAYGTRFTKASPSHFVVSRYTKEYPADKWEFIEKSEISYSDWVMWLERTLDEVKSPYSEEPND